VIDHRLEVLDRVECLLAHIDHDQLPDYPRRSLH
jgi:hypothetical protein